MRPTETRKQQIERAAARPGQFPTYTLELLASDANWWAMYAAEDRTRAEVRRRSAAAPVRPAFAVV